MGRINIKTDIKKIEIRVTWPDKATENITVSGHAIHAKNGCQVDGEGIIRRTAPTLDDVEATIDMVVAAAVSAYRAKRQVTRDINLDQKYANEGLDSSTVAVKAFIDVEEDGKHGVFVDDWAESTYKQYMSYFRINILPKIQYYEDADDFSEVELNELRDGIKESVKADTRSSGSDDNADASAKKYLNAADKIYTDMRLRHPELPALNLSVDENLNSVQKEQLKSIPLEVYLQFHVLLEDLIVEDPYLARAIILMDCGALRAGEAAASYQALYEDRGDYIIVWVLKQEYEGRRIDRLKRPSSYRHVILDEWGSMMLRRANAIIGPEDNADTTPIKDTAVSAKVKDMLIQCGLSNEYIMTAYDHMALNPDCDKHGHPRFDVSAHLLRRNRASIWLNYCAYTQDELDYYLGHKIYKSRFEYDDPQWEDTQKKIAIKNSRFNLYPDISNSPKHKPMEVNLNTETELYPFSEYQIINASDKPLYFSFQFKTAEPGESISLILNKDIAVDCHQISSKFDGKRSNENIIGIVRKDDSTNETEKDGNE